MALPRRATVSVRAAPGGAVVVHELAHACCLRAKVSARLDGDLVVVTERLVGTPCRCECGSVIRTGVGLPRRADTASRSRSSAGTSSPASTTGRSRSADAGNAKPGVLADRRASDSTTRSAEI